ncbi:excinuclease ABC subunit UvrC [Hyphococcus luteus]|uniref:UvrABC system protein C n=1 Tax=Hyphococcus luteus TaxID=2058213 RepID=A0A2S7K0X1_9PROT|nr:excinuclease ABC subunit UvrC [Marinicaulis flavus]PQA86154.1 excinuclease ABC subunit C [Marinicaulis flavus]
MSPEAPEIKGKPALAGAALIADEVRRLPAKPGVYRMYGAKGEVLYVGKAKNLKNRVSSYAQGRGHSNRILRMISETRAMEFVVTATETEALLLEANLIKQLKPRYNVILRDDKSFPFILVAEDHDAPQILKHRGAQKRPGSYYGPFASAGAVNRTLNTLQKAFLLRSCSDSAYEGRTRPCLLHQIKRCSAPCVGLVSAEEYKELVAEAKAFLSGESASVQKTLSEQMEKASADLDFETAAALRDRIRALSYIQGAQDINPGGVTEADVFAIHSEGGQSCVQVFLFRAGQNWGNHAYFPKQDKEDEPPAVLDAFIAQFYDAREPPPSILVNVTPPQGDLLAEALTIKAGRKVTILTPQRGEKRDLVKAAEMNARESLSRRMAESASQQKSLRQLSEVLGLEAPPQRIEVYDNSHIQGSNAVGAMIVAGPEGFVKNQYRKFNIKTESLAPGDDFGMMREVLTRRFARMLKEENAERPELVIIDGGKGQLSVVLGALNEMGFDPEAEGVTIIGVAKGRRENEAGEKRIDRTAGATGEQVVMPGREPFTLPPRDPGLFVLQRLRDEAHRFAIGAHRAKRKKAIAANPLDGVPGIGAKRKRALLHHFGSAKEVASAKPADLEAVEGVSAALAQKIYDYFHGG